MDESPIYDFKGLKELLVRKGYIVGKAVGYKEVENKDVTLEDLTNNLEFTNDGIFLTEDDGSRQQVFLYKRSYHLRDYGKPRFHVRKCSTMMEFINSGRFRLEYRRANTKRVWVKNMDNAGRDEIVDDLPLCKNCLACMRGITRQQMSNMSLDAFVELLKEAKDADPVDDVVVEVNPITGYTKDWRLISHKYMEKNNYTCEKCKVKIMDVFDRQYMYVRHINGVKTNNRDSNLQCLCIDCMSKVDKSIIKGAGKILLQEFLKKYKAYSSGMLFKI